MRHPDHPTPQPQKRENDSHGAYVATLIVLGTITLALALIFGGIERAIAGLALVILGCTGAILDRLDKIVDDITRWNR